MSGQVASENAPDDDAIEENKNPQANSDNDNAEAPDTDGNGKMDVDE
jgi:hypothetical protein